MALLFMDGFDARDAALKWSSGDFGWVTGRFGASALNPGSNTFGGGSVTARIRFTAAATTVVGFGLNSDIGSGAMFAFWGDNAATQHLTITVSATNTIELRRGDHNGTIIATSASLFTINTWDYWEAKAKIDPTTGTFELRRNGTVVMTFSGNTKNGGTNNSIDAFGFLQQGNFATHLKVDDLYILDTTGSAPHNDYLGDVRIYTLVPTGAGNSTGLTPSTGANWAAVDELPWSATDYVSGSTAALKDTYATSDLPAGASTIYAVQVNTIAKKTDAGVRGVKTVVRRGGVDYSDATATNLGTSDVSVVGRRVTDPSTSAAWTVANVNAMEIGVEVA